MISAKKIYPPQAIYVATPYMVYRLPGMIDCFIGVLAMLIFNAIITVQLNKNPSGNKVPICSSKNSSSKIL